MTQDSRIEAARAFATQAHAGQVDKAGRPYIEHPARVARRLVGMFPAAPAEDVMAAWLHDVVEDCGIPLAQIRERFGDAVADVVALLSSKPGSYEDYIARIAMSGSPAAVRVKLADIADNSDPARLALLAPDLAAKLAMKYASARAQLLAKDAPPA